ncbi:MAG TPA: flagellar hook-associated protein FlgK [Thiotrichales bacterium]|nr:MAG: flagellar hook-associated protein FlgK [Thiotrichales bacterium 16-46-22]OZA16552.1 MAG: flagellar hook-associated protein FlgK [Thiotrichales bacterium 17-46-47]HQT03075.1 flagellar hook-associated protein FlgK [Thiotrichales bacterium]HQT05316.1 flagellar hook-associated protein FlgK [Thiotrichales bacterium]
MADLLLTASSGLRAFQQALNVTGHNIANVNTEGYNRQRLEINAGTPQLSAGGYVGTGARTVSINRVYQDYLSNQLNNSHTAISKYNNIDVYSTQLNGTLGDPEVGISAGMQNMFATWNTMANDPTNTSSPRFLLDSQAQLAMQVENYDSLRNDLIEQVNGQLSSSATQVNRITKELVFLNESLGSLNQRKELPANDLLDKRDQLVKELNKYMDTKVFQNDDGTIDVYTSDGKVPLITDNRAMSVYTKESPFEKYDAINGAPIKNQQLDLYIQMPGTGRETVISDSIKGGEIGGALAFRKDQLMRAEDELGLSVAGMAIAMNAQHRQGFDAAGVRGADLFSLNGKEPVLMNTASNYSNPSNTGTGSITSTGTPTSEFAYKLTFNGSSYDVTDAYSNRIISAGVTTAALSAGLTNFNGSGVTLTSGAGTPAKGDSFMVYTTTDFHKSLEQTAYKDTRNGGTLTNNDITINLNKSGLSSNPTDLSNPADFAQVQKQLSLLQPRTYSMTFDGSNYTISDKRTGQIIPLDSTTAAAGVTTLRFEGLQVDIGQTARQIKPGDKFEFRFLDDAMSQFSTTQLVPEQVAYRGTDNSGVPLAIGNNVNAANMASLQDKKILTGNQNTFKSAFSVMAGNVGTYHRTNEVSMETQEAVNSQLIQLKDSMSGVNLDEEAANMLKFQQAYQAAAQIMQASQRMFDTIIGALN